MAREAVTGTSNGNKPKRSRGQNKPFPPRSFEESLILPLGIDEHSVDGKIRRLTLMDQTNTSPSSSKSRELVSSAFKYGLIHGSYNSEFLQLTEGGNALLDKGLTWREAKAKQFELAIERVEPFSRLYHKLKGKKFPDKSILRDEFGSVGVNETDRVKAAEIFELNLRYVGLVMEVSGSEHVVTVDEAVQDEPEIEQDNALPRGTESLTETLTPAEENGNSPVATNRPALHIDIQVHIDPKSSAEQIDLIFASMARHFYGAES